MKLLLDQNLSRRLVAALDAHYPGTTQVALVGMEKASDEEIWEFAKKNEFTIVTKDSDFEEFSVLRGAPPKVIWIKLRNSRNETILRALADNREFVEKTLVDPAICCIELYA